MAYFHISTDSTESIKIQKNSFTYQFKYQMDLQSVKFFVDFFTENRHDDLLVTRKYGRLYRPIFSPFGAIQDDKYLKWQ